MELQTTVVAALWLVIGYLFGSLPTGYVVVKTKTGQDIRTIGSGNIGATNVGRVLGKKWAVGVTIVDMFKGGAVVLLCRACGGSDLDIALSALGAVLGHNYPVWLRFHGGKGVATTFGTLFFVQVWYSCAAVLLAGILWFFIMKATRYVSLASLVALLAIGGYFYFFGMHPAFFVLAFVLAAISFWRHRGNVNRLMHGTENKVGRK